MKRFELIREVTVKECPWLDCDMPKGYITYKYYGHTYGCVTGNGMACSDLPDKDPFYELPKDALNEIV